ncbi:MAG: murein biosynthesis integral membrane protein MurJ [Anaerolineae bacterium]|nr:murein biosynthesis integral membrane protein MurJ [Anaerolineae bacterium]
MTDSTPNSTTGNDQAPPARGAALTGRQIARATGVVMLAFVASRLLGLVRNAAIGAAFGAGSQLDAFTAAQRLPETLFVLVAGGALGSAFIPVFSRYLNAGAHNRAWDLASAVVNLLLVASIALTALAFAFAPQITGSVLVPEAPPPVQMLTADLMRVMLVTVVIFGVSGLLMGILNAHQHFLLPALAPSLYNLGIIAGALFLAGSMGVYGLAWGTVLGAALHFAVQLPGLRGMQPRYRPTFSLRIPGVLEVLALMGPRVLGLAIVQVMFWVNTALASGMVEGSIVVLTFAFQVMLMPQAIIAQSVATAVFPTLSAHAAAGKLDEFSRTLGGSLRSVLFLAIPATVGLVILAEPTVAVLYERNDWTAEHTAATAWVLAFWAVGLVGHSLIEILARAFYALSDTRTPVLVGGAAMLLNVAFSLVLIRFTGAPDSLTRTPAAGLALANSAATALESAGLWLLLRRRLAACSDFGAQERKVIGGAARVTAAAAAMSAAVYAATVALAGAPAYIVFGAGLAVGCGVFFVAALALGVPEARTAPAILLGRLRR